MKIMGGDIALLSDPRFLRQVRTQRGLGYLGDGLVGAAITSTGVIGKILGNNQAGKTASYTAEGASIGATFGPIGAGIGAAIGAIGSLFGPAAKSQSELVWDNIKNSIMSTPGTAYDEKYFGEAMKGMNDTNQGTIHMGHEDFAVKLANLIAQGYLQGAVPLTASPQQMWTNWVYPNLMQPNSGVQPDKWGQDARQKLVVAMIDRYVAGLPITRYNMPAYASQKSTYTQWNVPNILTALAPILQPLTQPAGAGTTAAPKTASPVTAPPSSAYNPTGAQPLTASAPPLSNAVTQPLVIPYGSYSDAQWLNWAVAADPTGQLSQGLPPGTLWGANNIVVQVSGIPANFWNAFLSRITPAAAAMTGTPSALAAQAAAPIPQSIAASAVQPLSIDPGYIGSGSSIPYTYPVDNGTNTVSLTPTPDTDIISGVPNLVLFGAAAAALYFMASKR